MKITHGMTAFDGFARWRRASSQVCTALGWLCLLSNRSSRPAEHARYAPIDWGMAFTHEPSEIAMTRADLLRSTSYVREI